MVTDSFGGCHLCRHVLILTLYFCDLVCSVAGKKEKLKKKRRIFSSVYSTATTKCLEKLIKALRFSVDQSCVVSNLASTLWDMEYCTWIVNLRCCKQVINSLHEGSKGGTQILLFSNVENIAAQTRSVSQWLWLLVNLPPKYTCIWATFAVTLPNLISYKFKYFKCTGVHWTLGLSSAIKDISKSLTNVL